MLHSENLLDLTQAAKRVPGRPHSSTIWRWCRRGCKSRAGPRVYLEHLRYGSRVFTSIEALGRFAEALANADAAHFDLQTERPRVKPNRRSLAQKQRDVAEAEAELAAEGI